MDPNPVGIYLIKVNNRNTRTRCEICSKLTIKAPETTPLASCKCRLETSTVNVDWKYVSKMSKRECFSKFSWVFLVSPSKTYLESSRISTMELFVKIING